MQLNVPPIIPYAIGALLVMSGVLRAKYLGAPRTPAMTEQDAETSTNQPEVRGKEQRRHLRMGVIWVLLGLFLLVSTYIQARRR
jgi:uncharacterized membrane protein HdeD (DUF308 family)